VTAAFDALVLAGGAARRLDGADKPAQLVGTATLLSRVLAAVADACTIVVVGPPRADLPVGVLSCVEDPPGGGPVAAIAAGLALVDAETVAVLAADLPDIAPAVHVLLAAIGDADVAALTDRDGRLNYLAATWRTAALRRAVAAVGDPHGASMRQLMTSATMVQVPDPDGWGRDCDTWDDLAAARRASAVDEPGGHT